MLDGLLTQSLAGDGLLSVVLGDGFDPKSIDNLFVWLDPSVENSITETSGSVSQVDDLSGNDYHVIQNTESRKPVTNTDTINGLNVLTVDGTKFMDFNSAVRTMFEDDDFTVFSVIESTSGDVTQSFLAVNIDNTGSDGVQFAHTDFNASGRLKYDDTSIEGTTSNGNNPYIFGGKHNSGELTLFKSSGDYTTRSTNTPSLQYGTVTWGGAGYRIEYSFIGLLGETLIYNKALTDAEKNQVGNYLANKWGITWTDI